MPLKTVLVLSVLNELIYFLGSEHLFAKWVSVSPIYSSIWPPIKSKNFWFTLVITKSLLNSIIWEELSTASL